MTLYPDVTTFWFLGDGRERLMTNYSFKIYHLFHKRQQIRKLRIRNTANFGHKFVFNWEIHLDVTYEAFILRGEPL